MEKTRIHPTYYMPVKTLYWFPADPEHHTDTDDKSKIYNAEEVAELNKKFFLIIVQILKTREDLAFSMEWDKKKKDLLM